MYDRRILRRELRFDERMFVRNMLISPLTLSPTNVNNSSLPYICDSVWGERWDLSSCWEVGGRGGTMRRCNWALSGCWKVVIGNRALVQDIVRKEILRRTISKV